MPYYDTPPRVTDLLAKIAEEQRRSSANRRVENAQIARGGITVIDRNGNVAGILGEVAAGEFGVAQAMPDGTIRSIVDVSNEAADAASKALEAELLAQGAEEIGTEARDAAAAANQAAAEANAAADALNDELAIVETTLAAKADKSYADTIKSTADAAKASAATAISDAAAANTAAGNAQTTANTANTKALEAAGIANAKGKVYYGTAAPAADPNGLWIDQTGGANTPKRHNGSSWVAVTDKVAIDAAAAAANAKTAADNAQAAANTADQKAVNAASQAATAISNAATAHGIAVDAQTAADAAQDAADLAQSAATSANNLAAQAKTVGEAAAAAAATAQSKADAVDADLTVVETLLPSKADVSMVQSRGTDLIANGTGFLGNNYNFSSFTYDGTDAPPGAKGSFTDAGASKSYTNDELIPVDMGKKYILSAWARQQTPGVTARFYIGLAPHDAWGLTITPQHYAYRPGTMTTLAADLKPGDTTVTLTDATGWAATGDASGQKYVGFWNYTDPNGRLWEPGTYTRRFHSWVSRSGATVTLSSAHSGDVIPAGTKVSNNVAGGSYMYTTASNQVAQQTWTQYTSADISGNWGHIGGIHDGSTGLAATGKFPPGTAAVKILFLTNRDATGGTSKIAYAGLSLSDANAAKALADAAALAASTADGKAVTAQARADAAHALATTGKSTADTALASANGKNKVTYSTSQPGSTANSAGDTWFQRDANGNTLGQWEGLGGTSWAQRLLRHETMASVDASKIVVGTLDAARIAAGSITVGQIKPGDVATPAQVTAVADVANAALPRIDGRVTHNPFSWQQMTASIAGSIVIKTPITFTGPMVRIKISGRQLSTTGSFEVDCQFYAYNTSGGTIHSPSYTSSGEQSVTVRFAKTLSDNKAVIIIDKIGNWGYPSFSVTEVHQGYVAVDATTGWSAAITTDLSDLTAPITAPARDIQDTHTLTQGWRTTGTTLINGGKIYTDSITSAQIAAGAIKADEIDAGAVTAVKVAANAITAGKIDVDAVTARELKANAVEATHISALAVQTSHLAADSVAVGKIAALAVNTRELAANSVVAAKIAAGEIQTSHIKALNITSALLASEAVVAGKVAANAITVGTIAANAVTSGTVAANAILAGHIKALEINSGHLAADSVIAGKIAALAIGTRELQADAVTAAKIKAGEIQTGHIAAGAIKAGQLDAGAVTAEKLTSTAIDGKVITGALIRTAASGRRLEFNTTSMAGWGNATNRWLSLDEAGLRTYYSNGNVAQYLWTGEGADGGLWTYRSDNTPASSINAANGLRVFYADGVTRSLQISQAASGTSSGVWMYRADGSESGQFTQNGFFTRDTAGNVVAQMTATGMETNEVVYLKRKSDNFATVRLHSIGVDVYRDPNDLAMEINKNGVQMHKTDLGTTVAVTAGGVYTYRPDLANTKSSVAVGDLSNGLRGVRVYQDSDTTKVGFEVLPHRLQVYYPGTTTTMAILGRTVGGDSGLWMYRSTGTEGARVTADRVATYREDGTLATNIWTGGINFTDNAGATNLYVNSNNVYPQQRIWAKDALSLTGGNIQGLVVQNTGVVLTNYLYSNFMRTTTWPANMHWSSGDAQIYQVSSMGYNKLDQEEISLEDAQAILSLTPKTWRDRGDVSENPDTATRIPGFVAEEVQAASDAADGALEPLIVSGVDTQGTQFLGVNYDRVPAYLIPIIRDLQDRVVALERALNE